MDGAVNPPQHQDVGSVWDNCGVRFQHHPPPAILLKFRFFNLIVYSFYI